MNKKGSLSYVYAYGGGTLCLSSCTLTVPFASWKLMMSLSHLSLMRGQEEEQDRLHLHAVFSAHFSKYILWDLCNMCELLLNMTVGALPSEDLGYLTWMENDCPGSVPMPSLPRTRILDRRRPACIFLHVSQACMPGLLPTYALLLPSHCYPHYGQGPDPSPLFSGLGLLHATMCFSFSFS